MATMTGFFDSVEIRCLGSMIFSFGPAFFSYVRGPDAAARFADAARAGAAAGAYAYFPDPYHFEVSSSHEYILSPFIFPYGKFHFALCKSQSELRTTKFILSLQFAK